MKRFWGSRFFRKTMLSYTIILSIPIVIFCTLMVRQVMTEQKTRQETLLMNKCKGTSDYIEEKFYELNHLGDILLNFNWVQRLTTSSAAQMDIPELSDIWYDPIKRMEAANELTAYKSNLGVLKTLAVVLPQKDVAVCPMGWCTTDELMNSMSVGAPQDQKKLLAALSEWSGFQCVDLDGLGIRSLDRSTLMLAQNLDYLKNPRTVLLLEVDKQAFRDYVRKLNYDGLVSVSVKIGGNTFPVYSAEQENKTKLFSTEIQSKLYKWEYSVSYQYGDVNDINTFTLLFTALFISLLLGTLGSYCLACVSYKPVGSLMEKMQATGSRGDEYQMIENSIDTLIKKNTDLQKEIGDYYNIVRNNLLLNLTYGYFDEKHVEEIIRRCGLGFSGRDFYACVLIGGVAEGAEDRNDSDAKTLETILNLKVLLGTHGTLFELTRMLNNDIAIIVYGPNGEKCADNLKSVAERVQSYVKEKFGGNVQLFSGDVAQGIIGISRSYHIAKEKSDNYFFRFNNAAVSSSGESGYYYPTDWEIQLINQLKIGNYETAKKVLNEIRDENGKRCLSRDSSKKLAFLLLETLTRVVDELKIDIRFSASEGLRVMDSADGEDVWDYLDDLCRKICDRTSCPSGAGANDYGHRITEYVENHFSDSNVSLKELSGLFNLSVSAVSKIFKQTMNINFYDYLCRIRMEKAKELMASGATNIRKIGVQVGYENEYSFRRTFQRYEGIKVQNYMAKHRAGTPPVNWQK